MFHKVAVGQLVLLKEVQPYLCYFGSVTQSKKISMKTKENICIFTHSQISENSMRKVCKILYQRWLIRNSISAEINSYPALFQNPLLASINACLITSQPYITGNYGCLPLVRNPVFPAITGYLALPQNPILSEITGYVTFPPNTTLPAINGYLTLPRTLYYWQRGLSSKVIAFGITLIC